MDRRSFLLKSLKLASYATFSQSLLEALTRGNISGQAMANGSATNNYIVVELFGAPPRWYFDLLLEPFRNDKRLIAAPGVGSAYVNKTLIYRTHISQAYNVYLPPIWFTALPKSGGSATLQSLLPHTLMIRGVDTGNPDHATAMQSHFRPVGSTYSIPGLTADRSDAPVGGLVLGGTAFTPFVSSEAKSVLNLRDGTSKNYSRAILNAFTAVTPDAYKAKLSVLEKEEEALRLALNDSLLQYDRGAAVSIEAQKGARKLINKYDHLHSAWEEKVKKYKNLIAQSLAIFRTSIANPDMWPASGQRPANGIFNFELKKPVLNASMASMLNTARCDLMAEQFATTELVLDLKLSSFVALCPGSLTDLTIFTGVPTNGATYTKTMWDHNPDEHVVGSVVSYVVGTAYYHCLGSCLLEFVAYLQNHNLFENTVIDVASEFGRTFQSNLTGSGHEEKAKSIMVISGKIAEGPIVLGGIRNNTTGVGADRITVSDGAATLAAMLGVQAPQGGSSLVKVNNGTVVAAGSAPRARVV